MGETHASDRPTGGRTDWLPIILITLTSVTGVIDAASFLGLGHIFVANMTGNVVFLGFAAAGAQGFSIAASFLALCGFLAGATLGGRLAARFASHRRQWLALSMAFQLMAVFVALAITLSFGAGQSVSRRAIAVALALGMGVQNATARKLAVPYLTTTVMTSTLTGLVEDGWAGRGTSSERWRGVIGVAALLFSGFVGAMLFLQIGIVPCLVLALGLLVAAAAMVRKVKTPTG